MAASIDEELAEKIALFARNSGEVTQYRIYSQTPEADALGQSLNDAWQNRTPEELLRFSLNIDLNTSAGQFIAQNLCNAHPANDPADLWLLSGLYCATLKWTDLEFTERTRGVKNASALRYSVARRIYWLLHRQSLVNADQSEIDEIRTAPLKWLSRQLEEGRSKFGSELEQTFDNALGVVRQAVEETNSKVMPPASTSQRLPSGEGKQREEATDALLSDDLNDYGGAWLGSMAMAALGVVLFAVVAMVWLWVSLRRK